MLKERDADRWTLAVAPSVVKVYRFWEAQRLDRRPGTVEDDFGFELQRVGAVRTTPKTGRNTRCACGSGKSFKKCCGSTEQRGAPH